MSSSRYRSLSGSLLDNEKHEASLNLDDNDSDLESPTSHTQDLSSYTPFLRGNAKSMPSFAYHLPRRRFTRYFTLSIIATILLFAFYLIRSSSISREEVKAGINKPPPPPPAYEQFPFLKRYHGGIRTLVSREENKVEYPAEDEAAELRILQAAMAQKQDQDKADALNNGFQKRAPLPFEKRSARFDPYPNHTQTTSTEEYEPAVPCHLDDQKTQVPQLLAYQGVTLGFPDAVMGSYDLLGLRKDVCFERFGRLGPYGYGYSRKYGGSGAGMEGDRDGSEQVWNGAIEIDYRNVQWGKAQEACMIANQHRFRPHIQPLEHSFLSGRSEAEEASVQTPASIDSAPNQIGKEKLPRTAVIIRTWWDYEYDVEDIFYLRAMINELSIQSGAEYTVHFLIHVKDDNKQIWADEETYQRVLNDSLPAEFRGMGTLWSERQMGLIYGGVAESFYRDLPVHGAYRSTFMPVQYFAHTHPEYDFFWHWEMDIRYTGHFYHLFTQISHWAKQQPRKGLWERNGRFYIPSEHGSWDDFRHLVRVQTEHGTASKQNMYDRLKPDAAHKHPLDEASRMAEIPIWGPLRPQDDEVDSPSSDPEPPTSYDKDDYTWGVGEDADLITFNPLFDPQRTNWILAEDVTGYNTTRGFPPRRTAIITAGRLSRRLLTTMHRETALRRHTMFSEMWPGSCALHHGYKAVYAPHPVYIDRAWPTSYLAAVFNNGRNGAAGGARTSVFSDERQINFLGVTWYYHAGFAPNLWKRWLGYKVDNDGGEEWELAHEGRMCLPAMLLHPVKHVDMVYEHEVGG